MIKNICLFISLLIVFAAKAQAQQVTDGQQMLQKITGSDFKIYYQQYDGNPYYSSHWANASVKLVSGEVYSGLLVKIDIYNDQLISYNKRLNKQITVDKSIIDEIYLYNTNGGQTHLIKNVFNTNVFDTNAVPQTTANFYFVLLNDSISVWRSSKKLIEKYSSLSNKPNMIGRFYTKSRYYYVKNGNLHSIPVSKKKLAKEFANNKKEIMHFINKNRYKPKNETDIIAIFKYINELIKGGEANK